MVTGGAPGMAPLLRAALPSKGAHIVIGDVHTAAGKTVAGEVGGTFVHCDASVPEQVAALVDTAVAPGPLRRVVASAGVGHTERTVTGSDDDHRMHDLEGQVAYSATKQHW
ncbi:SDR family oxidoreductase [Rhodococcus chondri]|uniref:SDR family oxidoreductase n=1 Tax=Rhodococcus chondri TaxID=3065941 RepID=A0ABU7JM53_9NOCA|nr:SDR family oxidoreductase [Rhodococcus sp. CC-R104]MEE2031114.1 SDR family oxidoreductase [Rhodococcus sp. CC-R104]